MNYESGPAFPYWHSQEVAGEGHSGMTLRDYFAGQGLTGWLAGFECTSDGIEDYIFARAAADSYRFADAMLAQRTRP